MFLILAIPLSVMDITIRKITLDDAIAVNRLSHQLGYPLTLNDTTKNLEAILQSDSYTGFVAEVDNRVIGWIGASQVIMIELMPHCEINGLVVDNGYYGKGVGKLLVDRVKQWAIENGNKKLSLHCNVKRTEAHSFYLHLVFKSLKQQTNFVMDL